MKIEIDIPQLTELNRKLEQLIDTLNDVAVMQVNALRKPSILEAASGVSSEVLETHRQLTEGEPAPKRTRKKRETTPEPEVITYSEAEVQAANEVVQAAAAIVAEQEQPAPVAAEEETPALPVFDLDYLRNKVVTKISDANELPKAKEWITQHGAPALKDLDPKHYAAFHKFACELCGVENL